MARINQYEVLGLNPEEVFLADPDNRWFMKGVSPSPQFIPSKAMNPITLIFTLALFIPITLLVIQLSPDIDRDTWIRLLIVALIVAVVIAFVVYDRIRTPSQLLRGWPGASILVGQVIDCSGKHNEFGDYPSYVVTLRYSYQLPDDETITGVDVSTRNDIDGEPLPKPGTRVVIVRFQRPIAVDWFARQQDFVL